eukprot:gene17918-22868_t
MEVEDDFFSSQPEMMDRGVYGGHNRNQNRNNQRNENQHSSGSAGGNYGDGMTAWISMARKIAMTTRFKERIPH